MLKRALALGVLVCTASLFANEADAQRHRLHRQQAPSAAPAPAQAPVAQPTQQSTAPSGGAASGEVSDTDAKKLRQTAKEALKSLRPLLMEILKSASEKLGTALEKFKELPEIRELTAKCGPVVGTLERTVRHCEQVIQDVKRFRKRNDPRKFSHAFKEAKKCGKGLVEIARTVIPCANTAQGIAKKINTLIRGKKKDGKLEEPEPVKPVE